MPGNRPERFEKALASDADVICIDLEDSVAASDKAKARANASSFVSEQGENDRSRLAIRLNAPTRPEGHEDLAYLEKTDAAPALILLPKVESADDILPAAYALEGRGCAFIPLIETPRGIAKARGVVEAHPAIAAIMFGGADYAARLGIPMSWEGMLHARQELVFAAALKGIPAIDVPKVEFADLQGLAVEAERARAIGFQGKAAIHPAQIDVINRCFSPTEDEIKAAKSAIAAFQAQSEGVMGHEGQMVEAPLLARYQRILDAAARIRKRS